MSTLPHPHGPSAPPLDDDEERVARARRRLTVLATALVQNPLDRQVHQDLRAFMDSESEPALQSWEALLSRSPDELRERIRTLLGSHVARRAS
ncbi:MULTISPECIES: hypothetical protein [Streptomyces]|uniref:hypothetical protein n=1 Tax=Streptomyces TaxID=1883 RepID=UPI000A3A3F7A|nr:MULTISPECIES: hypothetical protein [Streptomyces]NUK15804.1 hypothetical protein [Streptomyces lunaelactis]